MDNSSTTVWPLTRASAPDRWLFARNFMRHPFMLGSIIPSSGVLVDAVLSRVNWPRARVIVEYGPGVGTFTAEILQRMRPDARLVVVETNADFVRFMRESLHDPRLVIEHESAENVLEILLSHGLPLADCIISGIPLGSFPKDLQASIVRASRGALVGDGAFLVYQFTARVLPVLHTTFPVVHSSRVWRNFPPAHVFACGR